MSNEKNNYNSIFKATALLGSVQFFNILIGVAKNKIVSVLLGTAGMGIVGMLTSAIGVISAATNLGVVFSGMKNVSQAHERGDSILLGKSLYVIKKLVWGTGLLASIICLILCRRLSIWSFGNEDFTISFAFLSISLLFIQLNNENILAIQGCRQLQFYAKANVFGNLMSFVIAVPLYYLWGKDAIVPVLILTNISTFLCSYFYQKRIGIKLEKTDKEEFKEISFDIIKSGIAIASAEFFPIAASFLVRQFISTHGGLEEVGLFAAGFAILNSYVGMVFSAISSDYFPRLAGIADDDKKCEEVINQQIQMTCLLIAPLASLLIVFASLVIRILYTDQFLPMAGMISWGCLGMIIKVPNWCFGGVLIPKRANKPYFILAVVSAISYVVTNILLFYLLGITGLGIAFCLWHFGDIVFAYIYVSRKYSIDYWKTTIIELLILISLVIPIIVIPHFGMSVLTTKVVQISLAASVCYYSYKKLNGFMNLSTLIKNKFKKNNI